MKPFSRSDRVSGLIHKNLAEMLQKQINDPRLANTTITGVKVSSDLRIAKVYFRAPSDGKPADGKPAVAAQAGFQSAAKFIKRELAQRLGLRYMPDLKFFFDESIDYSARIEQLLDMVKKDHETDH
jgi:ribosome-binding factor A